MFVHELVEWTKINLEKGLELTLEKLKHEDDHVVILPPKKRVRDELHAFRSSFELRSEGICPKDINLTLDLAY